MRDVAKDTAARDTAARDTAREPKYWAFISYSHRDAVWGDWLHKALETYRVPKQLVGRATPHGAVPKRIYPVFRDREELSASPELSRDIRTALAESRNLVVICSPSAAKSRWVNEEILQFKRLGGSNRVLSLIVEGEPYAATAAAPGDECFPQALQFEVGDKGELTSHRADPIAGDVRSDKDGRENAKLKLIAGMLGVGYDELRGREKQRRRQRRVRWSAAALFSMVVLSAFSVWAIRSSYEAAEKTRLASFQQNRADLLKNILSTRELLQEKLNKHWLRTSGRSEAAVEPMEGDSDVKAAADELSRLLMDFEKKFGEVPLSEIDDLTIRLAQATLANTEERFDDALELVTDKDLRTEADATEAQIEREVSANKVYGEARYGRNEWKQAIVCYRRILNFRPDDLSARLRLAFSLKLIDEFEAALKEYHFLVEHYERAHAVFPNEETTGDLASSLNNRGTVLRELGRVNESLDDYGRAITLRLQFAAVENNKLWVRLLAKTMNNRAIASIQLRKYRDGMDELDRAIKLHDQLMEDDESAELIFSTAAIQRNRGIAFYRMKQYQDSLIALNRSLELFEKIIDKKNVGDVEYHLAATLFSRGRTLSELDRLDDAITECDRAIAMFTQMRDEKGRSDVANELAVCLNQRAVCRRRQGKLDQSLEDSNRAIEMVRKLVELKRRDELADELALKLSDRSNILRLLDRKQEALDDLNEAVKLRSRLVDERRREDLTMNLVYTLRRRADYFRSMDRHKDAITDFDQAIRRSSEYIEKNSRDDLSDALADCFGRRAVEKAYLNKPADAIADYDQAIKLYLRLSEKDAEKTFAAELARNYFNRAIELEKLERLEDAVADDSKAIEIRLRLLKKQENSPMRRKIAAGLRSRAEMLSQLGRQAKAVEDYRSSIDVLLKGIERGHQDLESELLTHLNSVAWNLATSRSDAVRNGVLALEFAKAAWKRSDRKNARLLDTLAAAYAETGDFAEAVKLQTKTIELADEKDKEDYPSRLKLYQAKKPYRED